MRHGLIQFRPEDGQRRDRAGGRTAVGNPPVGFCRPPSPSLILASLAMFGVLAAALLTWPARAVMAQQAPPEVALRSASGAVVGRHYRQTGEGSGRGYDVREPFFSRFSELGGPAAAGFPVSAPFRGLDGCAYQLFQVVVLQACPGWPVQLANTFQLLEEAGADAHLIGLGIGSPERDNAGTFAEAVQIRLRWLEDRAIRDRYVTRCGGGNVQAAIDRCGLPMNRPQLFGPFVSQRFQRIAFQRWLTDGPAGIQPGDVVAILGGDLLKQTGVVTGPVVRPHPIGEPPAPQVVPFTSPAAAAEVAEPLSLSAIAFRDHATLGILQTEVEAADRATPQEFLPGRQGQDLAVGDVVRTDPTGNALVTYFEGTTAEVGPSSRLVVQQLTKGETGAPQVSLFQAAGQVIHRVARALLPGARYEVQTPAATVIVRGTVLRMTVHPDGTTRIEVFSGRVEVAAQGITVVLYPGTFTEVVPGDAPPPPALNPGSAPFPLDLPGSSGAGGGEGPAVAGGAPVPASAPSDAPAPVLALTGTVAPTTTPTATMPASPTPTGTAGPAPPASDDTAAAAPPVPATPTATATPTSLPTPTTTVTPTPRPAATATVASTVTPTPSATLVESQT
ncbi:MAG: FecR family protein, partial [Chloroflexota bacterium]